MDTETPRRPAGDRQARPAAAPRGRKPFLQQSYGDMLRSLLVFAAVFAAIWGISQFLHSGDPDEPQVRTVDYASTVQAARQAADYEVLAPESLPDGWRATSADLDRSDGHVALHVGFLDQNRKYVGLEQSDGSMDDLLPDDFADLRTADTLTIDGRRWTVRLGDGIDSALVHEGPRSTVVVIGSADVGQLIAFARTLR